jgi:hypothetical protein
MTIKFDHDILFNNINILRKSKHLSKGEFNKLIGVTNVFRKNYYSIGAKLLTGIQRHFPGITEEWLLTPHDPNCEFSELLKLKTDDQSGKISEPQAPYINITEPAQDKHNDPNWALRALLYEIQEQLKSQRDFNAKINASILVKKKTHIDLWDVINRQQSMIDEISKILLQVGISGDLNLLKKLGGNG